MQSNNDESIIPGLDIKEQKIVLQMIKNKGDVVRTLLKEQLGGSNSTFVSKIESLIDKEIIEEYKRTGKRRKTAYKFSQHYAQILGLKEALKDKKWFSANQKIQLFPEFEKISEILQGQNNNTYKTLGIEPQYVSLETSLFINGPKSLDQAETRDVLSLCNAYFQNIITSKVHPKLDKEVEGYIIFHYNLKKPEPELQKILPLYLSKYLTATDLEQEFDAISKIGQLIIKYPDLIPILTTIAARILYGRDKSSDLKKLKEKFQFFKETKSPDHMTRMQALDSCLKIFKKFYQQNNKIH